MADTSDCGPTFTAWRRTPFMYVGDTYNVPNSPYSIRLTSMNCTGAPSDLYNQITVYKDGISIGSKSCFPFVNDPASCPTLFDSNNICISNGWMDCLDPNNCQYDIWYNEVIPLTATHVFEIKLTPYPWYTPQGAVDWLVTKISDVNGAILNIMSSLTGWSYVETIFSHDGTYVYIKVYMREEVQGIQTLSPLTLGQVATIGVAAGIIVATVGWIKDWIWGPVSAPENAGLSNKDLGDAGDKYIKQLLGDCELKICIDPTLTQDQKALCIKNCKDTILWDWKGYQGSIFPDADHTSLDTGRAEVQKCYDTYNSSGKTPADYQTLINCMQLKSNEAVTGDTNNTYITYPPNAPAGVTAQELAADCWIAGFVPGTCMLTAKTGKTIAIIGGVVIGGVILISLFKK